LLFDAQMKPKAAFWGIVDPQRLSATTAATAARQ
jgi:hypothetical protein